MDPPVPDESPGNLRYVINHVFLPPRLPQEDDASADNDLALVASLYKSLVEFSELEPTSWESLSPAIDMIRRFHNKASPTTVANIEENISNLADGGKPPKLPQVQTSMSNFAVATGHSIFYLQKQNAALLVTRKKDDILFQGFELLAPNDNVMSCEGALLREFPQRVALVRRQVVEGDNHNLQLALADAISTLELDEAHNAHPKTMKARTRHVELRDTMAPFLVTGLLMDVFVGLGRCVTEPKRFIKRSREQVNWSDALLPFHRSAVWLLLRVSLRLALEHQASCDEWPSPKALYKNVVAFHHCRLLRQATRSALGDEHGLLRCLTAKIARRIKKLDPESHRPWSHQAKAAVDAAGTRLKEQWETVQANDNAPLVLDGLSSLSFQDDSKLRLQNFGPYLSWVRDRPPNRHGDDVGPGDETTFCPLLSMELPAAGCLFPRSQGLQQFELLEFEAWVDCNLSQWREARTAHLTSLDSERRQSQVEDLVEGIDKLVNAYYCRANEVYRAIPEALSVMFLTVMELWVTLDNIAGLGVELLREYDPGLKAGLLNPLLLSTKRQMLRLQAVEKYLSRRKESAGAPYHSAFSDFGAPGSFAVRYVRRSDSHQRLFERIKEIARQEKAEKIREYQAQDASHNDLVRQRDSMDCTCDQSDDSSSGGSSDECGFCKLDKKIKGIGIDIFEWPLPADESQAMAAVFEIQVDKTVNIWRGATMTLLTKVFREEDDLKSSATIDKLWWVGSYSGIQPYLRSQSRLHPASTVKPANVSHYRQKHISQVTLQTVCVEHGSKYAYYDKDLKVKSDTQTYTRCGVPLNCSYARPGQFESWVRSPNHTPNEIIAGQAECPERMSLEEFRAIGNLRSGDGLQWANILCQLVIPTINLNNDLSYDLIMQASLEAGVTGNGDRLLRHAHVDAGCERFAHKAIESLLEVLGRVEESWQNEISLCILVRLSTRLLSVSSSAEVSNGFFALLDKIRRISIRWARELICKLDRMVSDRDREAFSRRILMSSLICAATFDIDAESLREVLGSANSLSTYTEVAALVHDHLPGGGIPSERISRHLLERWQRNQHSSYNIVKEEVSNSGNLGLDQTMKLLWGDFTSSRSGWRGEESPRGHILVTVVEGPDGLAMEVSFNTLNGLILVDDCPLARLPESFQTHSTFIELFGPQILDVMPSTVQGMQFSARREQMGWAVHFAMVQFEDSVGMVQKRLVIRAITKLSREASTPEVWEYIPRQCLRGDLPSSFVEHSSHWVNLSTHVVQFRAADHPWVPTPDGWTLTQNEQSSILSKGACRVVDPHSTTADEILKITGPLESRYHTNCIFHHVPEAPYLAVDLPRFSLTFRLDEGQSVLQSKIYPGMCVGKVQGIGTLIGLKSKLVLEPQRRCSNQPRTILIPEAEFSSKLVGHHVEVVARSAEKQHIRHHVFEVNRDLGFLSDRGALQSKLLVCYLHALTSNCLPDPLTSRSGTEEALRLLGSAAIRSANQLDTQSAEYLQAIAEVSPRRRYYPDHLTVMEQVKWSDNLPPLSQQDDFWPLAQAVHENFRDFAALFKSTDTVAISQKLRGGSSKDLVKRARLRSSVYRVSGFAAEAGCEASTGDSQDVSGNDSWYHSTDRHQHHPSTGCDQVSLVVRCLDTGVPYSLYPPQGSLQHIIQAVTGKSFSGTAEADLDFRVKNLEPPGNSIGSVWCNLPTKLADEQNKYRVMFFLATLLYAERAEWEVVQALMVVSQSSRRVLPPAEDSFDLRLRRERFREEAQARVDNLSYPVHSCPEWDFARYSSESQHRYKERRNQAWATKSKALKARFTAALANQLIVSWTLTTPTGEPYGSYFSVGTVMQRLQHLAEMCRRSETFCFYLHDLADLVKSAARLPDRHRDNISDPRTLPVDKPRCTNKRFVGANSLFSLYQAPQVGRPTLEQISATDPEAKNEAVEGDEKGRPLSSLLGRLVGKASQSHQIEYIEELRRSAESYIVPSAVLPSRDEHDAAPRDPHHLAHEIRTAIDTVLSGGSIADEICLSAGMYPRLSPVFILDRLTRTHWGKLSREWQICLIRYALSLVYLQRSERLAGFQGDPNRKSELSRELANLGSHDEDDLLQRPESLLLELEQGIMIRPVQQRTAERMIAPPNGTSAVMQLNMGEGKSSVIVPLVASALADGTRLVRVMVAKPLAKQMMQTLKDKLGGLLNRRVLYLPISRSTQLSTDQVEIIRQMINTCKEEGGVLLVQPEHLLSLKLMGIENIRNRVRESPGNVGDVLKLYQEIEAASRDIVDESDENFSVKFELVYTMGSQQPVEMSPERWILIEKVLEVVHRAAETMVGAKANGSLQGLLFEDRPNAPGGLPTIRALEEAAGRSLIEAIAHNICAEGLPGFPIQNQTPIMREAVLIYMIKEDLNQDEIARVEQAEHGFFGDSNVRQALLLLRGLLAKGVLLFALGQKRYRVNYGLAPDRRPSTMLAVPYRAKDMPSPRSEFSHPDVIIVLTCLSYYYRGLSFEELSTSLEALSRSDLANQEYSGWTSVAPTIPPTLRHFTGVNLKDEARCKTQLYPALRYVKPAIDFYLSSVVFPKEMKEFPSKLSASGWDLAKPKAHPLTGFSGTIDSKRVLPLAIKALDLPDQRHTNAAVLACLLRNENEVLELRGQQSQLSALTVEMLLDAVTQNSMRVILDVGAQIIECSNVELAKRWVDRVPPSDAEAVVFFNDDDELSVLTRDGAVDAFLTSSFASNTQSCLVFLDQAHTRGTDLRLPDEYRAAVTLGPAIPKDTLVQGESRLTSGSFQERNFANYFLQRA